MANLLHFELTTPERPLVKKSIKELVLPTQEGEIAVLPGHVPLVAILSPGMVTLRSEDGEEEYLAVDSGFIEVLPGNRIVVLADGAERADELDMEKVEEARQAAAKALENARDVDATAIASMTASLNREMARTKAIRKHRKRRVRP